MPQGTTKQVKGYVVLVKAKVKAMNPSPTSLGVVLLRGFVLGALGLKSSG